jgi:hypothetical protein
MHQAHNVVAMYGRYRSCVCGLPAYDIKSNRQQREAQNEIQDACAEMLFTMMRVCAFLTVLLHAPPAAADTHNRCCFVHRMTKYCYRYTADQNCML